MPMVDVVQRYSALWYDGTNTDEAIAFIGMGEHIGGGVIQYQLDTPWPVQVEANNWLVGLAQRDAGQIEVLGDGDYQTRYAPLPTTA